MGEPGEHDLWARLWRAERIRKARAEYNSGARSFDCLKNKTSDYALSIKMARDVSAQVLALLEASPMSAAASIPSPQGEKDGGGVDGDGVKEGS